MNTETVAIKMSLAIGKIRDTSLRVWVSSVVDKLPEKAWRREASLKYHHVDEHGDGGNMLHEIRVAEVADIICQLLNMPQCKRDLVRAASLLHDACRHGLNANEPYTIKEHAMLIRAFIEANCEPNGWAEPVCTLIDTHMARWGVPPYQPEMLPRDVLALADFIASQPNIEVHE